MDLTNLSANWKRLQATIGDRPDQKIIAPKTDPKRKRSQIDGSHGHGFEQAQRKRSRRANTMASRVPESLANTDHKSAITHSNGQDSSSTAGVKTTVNTGLSTSTEIGKYIAVDCEMVGVGPEPDRKSALARVSIVNYNGEQVYDSYVKPLEPVTDWRTHVSGVTPRHMAQARTFWEVQTEVASIIKDKVLIGHDIRHDLEALLLDHPKRDIRDTARHTAHRKLSGGSAPRLKILASELLGLQIQEGEHSSIDDARACMMLFRRDKAGFERDHAKKWPALPPPRADGEGTASRPKPKKKKKRK